jgi:hypothetical protein
MSWAQPITIRRVHVPPGVIEPHNDRNLESPEGTLLASNFAEFWFGDDLRMPERDTGIRLEFEAVIENALYRYVLPWLGGIGFLIALWRYIIFLLTGKG